MILQYFNGHYLIRAPLPAFGHLSEGATPQKLQHLVAVGHGAQDLVLHQLVVALAVGVAALGGGGGVCYGLSSSGPAAARAVGDHWRRELLQNLDAVAAVHLLALPLQAVLLRRKVAGPGGRARILVVAAGGGRGRRGGGRCVEAAGAVGGPHHRLLSRAGGGWRNLDGIVHRVEAGAGGGGGGPPMGRAVLVVGAIRQLIGHLPAGVLHFQPL